MYDKISVNVRGLESLGVSSSQYGSLLIPVIMSKLPQEVQIQVARNTAQEVWQMSDILDVIRQEVEAREISEGVKVNADKPNPTYNRMKTLSAAALSANVNESDPCQLETKLNVLIVVGVIIQPLVIVLPTCKLVWKSSEEIEDVLFACDLVIKAVHVVWTVGVVMKNIISPCVA